MKKTFFRMLPFVAAVVLAASCGKDGDSDDNISEPEPIATPENTETVSGNGFVEIPFSIKVNDGKSLSKVALDGATKAINFEPEDVQTVKLSVAGATIEGISGTLDLSRDDDGNYSFSGKITVPEGQKGAFSTGDGIDLVGTFTQDKGTQTTSTISFEDLWNHCVHTYKAEFKSTASSLELVDQNLYFYVATYKEAITINEKAVTSENDFAKGSYYAYEYEKTTVAGFDAGKTIAPSKLYTIGKAVTSVTINGVPTTTKVWGNAPFTITASVSPSGVTNPNVTWTVTQGSANLTASGENNASCSVLITGNSADLKIKATVDGVESEEVIIRVDKNYVDLGTGQVYWKTSDESSVYTFDNLPSGTPTKAQFDLLWTSSNVTVSGYTFTNKNGSGASITLQSSYYYWSSTRDGADYGWKVYVSSGSRYWGSYSKNDYSRVHLVRVQ